MGNCICVNGAMGPCSCEPPHSMVTVHPDGYCPCFDMKGDKKVATCQVCAVDPSTQPNMNLKEFETIETIEAFNCMHVDENFKGTAAPCMGKHGVAKPQPRLKDNGGPVYCDCLIDLPNGKSTPCPCALPDPTPTPPSSMPGMPAECMCAKTGGAGATACGCSSNMKAARQMPAPNYNGYDIRCLCTPPGGVGDFRTNLTPCPCNGVEVMLGSITVTQ